MAKAKGTGKTKEKVNLIARPDERQAAPVKTSWDRIEKWFEQHLPEVLTNLRPGVTSAELKTLEKAIGRELPADVVESWKIHDGENDDENDEADVPHVIFGVMRLTPLVNGEYPTLQRWTSLASLQPGWDARVHEVQDDCRSFPADAIKRVMGSPGWIPLHETAGGNFLGVDLDPGPNGRVGQVISFGRDEHTQFVLAPSWAHFLEDLADELEAGNGIVTRKNRGGWTEITFQLRGCNPYFANAYEAWSKAKLSKKFQSVKRVDRRKPEDDATLAAADLAEECVQVIRDFFTAMRQYEDTFLKLYPLSRFGVDVIYDRGPEVGQDWGVDHLDKVGGPQTPEQQVMWDNETSHDEKTKVLFQNSPRRQALAARAKIWRQFLADDEQYYADNFILRARPEYDPAKVVPTAVKTVRKDHVIVDLAPFIGNTSYEKTYRYHLKLMSGKWRIDYRERMINPLKTVREPFS